MNMSGGKCFRFLNIILTAIIIVAIIFGRGQELAVNAAEEGWMKSGDRWWYQFEDGTYAKSEYIDGYWIDANGWYDASWYGAWYSNENGWWFQSAGWYPASQWLKINKKWYHFSSSGYMDVKKWIGKSYVGEDGAWIEGYKNPDGSVGSGGNGKTVVIDPGHSSKVASGVEPLGPGSSENKAKDAGGTKGVSTGIYEYQLTMTMSEKLKKELEDRGYNVILTRSDNYTAISCKERAEVANNAEADAYIRIHADGSDNSSARGAMTICISSSNPFVPGMYSKCKQLSDDVLSEYCAATGLKNRGVWQTDTMSGNNWSKVPTTLIEMGFMTNSTEDTLMNSEDFQKKMVDGMANGIDKFLGEK